MGCVHTWYISFYAESMDCVYAYRSRHRGSLDKGGGQSVSLGGSIRAEVQFRGVCGPQGQFRGTYGAGRCAFGKLKVAKERRVKTPSAQLKGIMNIAIGVF